MYSLKCFSVVSFVLLICVGSALAGQSRTPSDPPWMPLHKQVQGPMKLFTTQTHSDTSTFTLYPADLPGVFIGDAVFIDFDNDGDLDILISGYDGSEPITRIYRNDNGTFTDIQAGLPGVISEHGVSWGDYDNDGDYDLAISGITDTLGQYPITKIFRNDNGTFVDIHANLPLVLGGVTSWIDDNLDGKLDLLIAGSPDNGSTFITKLYRNNDSTFTDSGIFFPGVWGASVDWGDYDNDGDPDLLLFGYGTWGVTGTLWRNELAGFSQVSIPATPANHVEVRWGDFDNDGDLDFIVAGDPPGGENNYTALFKNTGGGNFEQVPADFPQLNAASVAWGDYDNDGDLDFAICGWLNDSTNITKIYRNDGGGVFTDIDANLPGVWWGSVAWGDVDNDGKLDLLITGGEGPQLYGSRYQGGPPPGPILPVTLIYHNNCQTGNQKPAAPAAPSASVNGNQVTFSWATSTDDKTPQSMLTYNLRVGTSPGTGNIVAPAADAATGYRREASVGNNVHKLSRTLNLPQGTYYWSVQAIDNSYSGSAFTAEGVVGPPQTGPRWQLISLPFSHADMHTSLLFPTAVTNAFGFSPNTGYQVQDVLANGAGYWVKFPTEDFPTPSSGGTLGSATRHVMQGWNLLGSISQQIDASQITSQPPGMITSQFFQYDGSYQTSATIDPGRGYWVKVNQEGDLTISSTEIGDPASRINIVPTVELPPQPPAISPASVPKIYVLDQNYPNPFNPATVIRYEVPITSRVMLKVYNMLGQEVATLVDGDQDPGYKSVAFDAGRYPSGVYFYRLWAGSFTDVR
ncbi:MAG TPA: FG-GAP-like repeat-containing protein, partial [Bacteroidota bacterium]|nr:FG-GAP-like repeat-containing protein [Bacteroidota bacterium]